jgi:Na+-transporting NADH:ubiquinone oxidoreductase subunit NqrB
VPLIDNAVVAVLFLGSLLTRTPLILAMLDRDTLEMIPEKIRKSPYYPKAWRLVTWLWGLLYVAQIFVLAFLFYHHVPGAEAVDYILGWPIVAVFLVLSVMLPRWYWTVNLPRIEQEHSQAVQMSKS